MAGLASDTNEETLQDISAQLTHIFYPGFIKSLNDEMGFWSMLPKRKGEGKLIEVKFHYGRNTAAKSNTETGTAGDAVAQAYISGYGPWSIYTIPIEITDLSAAIAMSAGHGNYQAWADEVTRSAVDLRQKIEGHLFAAQTGNNCLGLPDYVDDGGTIDEIWGRSRAAYAFLKSIIVDAEFDAISFAQLRTLSRQMMHGTGADISGTTKDIAEEDQGGGRLDLILTTPEIESAYEALVTANGRYPLPAPSNTGLDPGQTGLRYKRAPVLASRFCTDFTLYGLDMRDWHIDILPQVLVTEKGQRVETDFALILEGRSGQSVKAFWRIYFQLVCEMPRHQGKIERLSHDEPS